ncbi:MAG TPA: hypothetical protein VG095_05235, partial [Chthoniobacterales bacterium]|nr:hypothetical protein [Chthoniobacterales bacterium]
RFGDVNDALARFYDRNVEKAALAGKIGEGALRRWIETALITPTGTRGLAFRGAKGAAGRMPGLALKQLEEAHLIRREDRAGTITHELTHDRFIEPIQQSNRIWLGRFAEAEKIRARLEEKTQSYETAHQLLDEACLREAEEFLATPEAELLGVSPAARELVRRSRQQVEEIKRAQARELEEAQRRAEEQRRRRLLERKFSIAVIALGAITMLAIGYFLYDLRAEKQQLIDRGAEFRKKAREDLADEDNPTRNVTALRNLSLALTCNRRDLEAAQLASKLLLEHVWCPPLAKEGRYRKDALLAATFAPENDGREVFAIAGNGELLQWNGDEMRTVASLFKKPELESGEQVVQPGSASFSPDGRWLLVMLPALSAGDAPEAGAQSAEQSVSLPHEPRGGQPRELQAWRWSAPQGAFAPVGAPLQIDWPPAARTSFVWANRSDQVVLAHYRGNAAHCLALKVGPEQLTERSGWNERLNRRPRAAALAFSADDTRLAIVTADRRVSILEPGSMQPIPGAIAGENEYLLPEGFQPNGLTFAPTENELTFTSWTGARTLDLRTGKLVPVSATFRDQLIRRIASPGAENERLVATALFGRIQIARAAEMSQPAEPVVFRGTVGVPHFSADGQRMLILSGGMANVLDSMRLVDVSTIRRATAQPRPVNIGAKPAPPWLAQLAAVVSALDAGGDGSLTTLEDVRRRHPDDKTGYPYEAVWKRFFP